jgi:hypothetical protein
MLGDETPVTYNEALHSPHKNLSMSAKLL